MLEPFPLTLKEPIVRTGLGKGEGQYAQLGAPPSSRGETVVGQSCIAVGVYQAERRPIAALSISMPTERMQYRLEEYLRIARRTDRAVVQQGISPQIDQLY
ncbi:IclR family transcriptional regulator C-terminal domain-containing protein [Mycolicibacterium sp. 624]|uniref:IclR family transcriptional regulator domain-containing protein n=1 Tax=Mycolicibacterium sp. 624 TaxID=3156314 RepID=UPI003397595D